MLSEYNSGSVDGYHHADLSNPFSSQVLDCLFSISSEINVMRLYWSFTEEKKELYRVISELVCPKLSKEPFGLLIFLIHPK
jgi:hypothetical protein